MEIMHSDFLFYPEDAMFVDHGFAKSDLYSVSVIWKHWKSDRDLLLSSRSTMPNKEWANLRDTLTQNSSKMMFPVIEAITENFSCYQGNYNGKVPEYNLPGWDFFLSCEKRVKGDTEYQWYNDYSYTSFIFNELDSVERHMELYFRLIDFLNRRFLPDQNFMLEASYCRRFFTDKMTAAIEEQRDRLDGKRFHHAGDLGRLIRQEGEWMFMPDRCEGGYSVKPKEIMEMAWNLFDETTEKGGNTE